MTETRRHAVGDETREESLRTQRWTVVPPARPASRGAHRQDLRTSVAIDLGHVAAVLSRRLGMGSGAMIGGRLALALQPRVLRSLVAGRRVVMVTGTNGKTTTTRMVVEALRSQGDAVSNATGANMPDGHVAALMTRRDAPYAALEVDELHLAQVTGQFEPAVAILLNLSRDQLDRVGEIRTVERSIRCALQQAPGMHVVANRDDPNIVSAAIEHPHVTWISGGARWVHDALNCPRCGAFIEDTDQAWRCGCGLARPEAHWRVTGDGLIGPDGRHHDVPLGLPGHVNRINAAFALAAALELGCDREAALLRIGCIEQANGRYGTVNIAGRPVRLLLAKNPASWLEMLDLVSSNDRPLLLMVNSREADGLDVSWLWDVDFDSLVGRSVMVAGDRGLDLAVRLRYAGVQCEVVDNVDAALNASSRSHVAHARSAGSDTAGSPTAGSDKADSGVPEVIANYTAFRDLFARSTA